MTGVVALLLQKKPKLKLDDAIRAIATAAVRDGHTGASDWTPIYGAGKINLRAALDQI